MKSGKEQLGMDVGTASHRLLKDILFSFIQKENCLCFRCKEEMTRENFSIEHIIPWLNSEAPEELFFNLNNIAFSHLTCNIKAARKNKGLKKHGASAYKHHKCRCEICKEANRIDTYKYRK